MVASTSDDVLCKRWQLAGNVNTCKQCWTLVEKYNVDTCNNIDQQYKHWFDL
jgi:hypothetical protein